MKWQKLAVAGTAIVAMLAVTPIAQSVTLKATVSLTFVVEDSGGTNNLDKPVKVGTQDIIKACATANGTNASDLMLVFVLSDPTDSTTGELDVVGKNSPTNVECRVMSVREVMISTKCKPGSKSSTTKAFFTFDASGIESNSVDLDPGFEAFGLAVGQVVDASTNCTGGTVVGATFKGNLEGESNTQLYQGSISISGKDLE